jgi:5'-nucleotidase (lipoprotein e(P4) family)
MKRFFFFLLLTSASMLSVSVHAQKASTKATSNPTQNGMSRSMAPLEYSLDAVLWQQRSGEYKALCYQAFSLAKMRLNEKIALHTKDQAPLAIITDVDETILDNSPQQAHALLAHTTYTDTGWHAWTSKASAAPVPGAVAFFQYADKMGIQCFYISNRQVSDLDVTIKNLKAAGFPQVDSAHVLLVDTTSFKEPRRQKVKRNYTIAMLLGDNLNDFDAMFYKQPADVRVKDVQDNSMLFGDVFIVLPNPMYGDWESALWNGKPLTADEMDKAKHEALISY